MTHTRTPLDPASSSGMPRTLFSRLSLTSSVIIPVAALLFLALGWLLTERVRVTITQAAIGAYQETEMEIVRSVARSIQSYVTTRLAGGESSAVPMRVIEEEIFRLFVDPIHLLQSGDAWIYAPDHVVYDESSDFPGSYRGKSMEEIFAIQGASGASHYAEMTAAVMHAREGSGWYIWLPKKGPEIAAWTPVHAGPFTWTIGLSTPLHEILGSTGASDQIHVSRGIMLGVTILVLTLLFIWGLAEIRRVRTEWILSEQRDLSLSLGTLLPLDESLRLCAETAARLVKPQSVAIYLAQPDMRHFTLCCQSGGLPGQAVFPPDRQSDGITETTHARLDAANRADHTPSLPGSAIVDAPIADGSGSVGFIAMTRCAFWRSAAYRQKALEGVATVLGNALGRLRMEESVRESERRFRSVVDTAADAIITVDPDGRIVFWNRAAERSLGRPSETTRGTSLADYLVTESPVAPCETDRPASVKSAQGVRPDGSRFPVDISSASWKNRDGTYATYIIRDMSLHEKAERERWELEQRLHRAQRMESLGMLAGGVAHDLNNALTPIVGYADLMLADATADSPLKDSLMELYRSARSAGAIVQDLLTLGRRGTHEMTPMDLNSVIASYLASPSFGEMKQKARTVSVMTRLASTISPLLGSTAQLTTLLENLLLNAFEAMPEGGEISVATDNRTLDAFFSGYERIEAGTYVVLEVQDRGSEISARNLERIFEPFYAKNTMGRAGSGLALAVVYRVAHDHKARVDVESTRGGGTCFRVWFPVSGEQVVPLAHSPGELRGGETILVVDDQPEVRAVASRLLERLGYRVQAAEHGHAAVAYLREHDADLVVLDMIMEEDFDGLACWQEIRRIRPRQKAIIVSGFAETDRVQEAQRLGAGAFVRKPYSAKELAAAIRQELSRPEA